MPAPRKPTNLKIIEGNPGKRPLNTDEPQPPAGISCPRWLSADARREWKRIKPVLESCRILTKADLAMLASYCQAWADYKQVTRALNAMDSHVIDSPQGSRIAPEVHLQRKFFEIILKAGAKLGLSPADRTGIKVPPSGSGGKWGDIK